MRLGIVSGNCATVLDQTFVPHTLLQARLRTEDTGRRYLLTSALIPVYSYGLIHLPNSVFTLKRVALGDIGRS